MYKIYCHIFPNGKRYIGLTGGSLEKRWQNGNGYETCPLMARAIRKYGWENVKHEVLEEVSSKEDAEDREKYYIGEFDTTDPEKGYNILPGGDVSDNHATAEMRYKLGNGKRGRHHTEEEKMRISEGVKRAFDRPESNGHCGLAASAETRKKMSESHSKNWEGNDARRKGASDRMKERMADPEFRGKVIANLREHRPDMRGKSLSESHKKKISQSLMGKRVGKNSSLAKPVNQYTKSGEFVKRWDCARDAERAGFGSSQNINKCCRHCPHSHTACGFVWEWAD